MMKLSRNVGPCVYLCTLGIASSDRVIVLDLVKNCHFQLVLLGGPEVFECYETLHEFGHHVQLCTWSFTYGLFQ